VKSSNVSESTMSFHQTSEGSQSRIGASDHFDLPGCLAVVFAAACWGLSGVFVKFIVAGCDITALALAFWRDLCTCLCLLIGVGLLHPAWLRVQRNNLPWLAAMGVSLGTFHVFWNLGILINGAAASTVQQAAMPAIVALAARLIWRESFSPNKILAIILTFSGTVFVSGLNVSGQTQLSWPGFLIGLAIPIMYAAWNLFAKKVRQHYNPFATLTYAFGFGALILLPFQFFTPQPGHIPPVTWLWFAGLIGVATIAPFSAYAFALGRLQASVAAIMTMVEIPIVSVYAYFLLDEWMSVSQICGALLVISGVLLLSWRRRQKKN